jgi:hypothetical protein
LCRSGVYVADYDGRINDGAVLEKETYF